MRRRSCDLRGAFGRRGCGGLALRRGGKCDVWRVVVGGVWAWI